MDPVASTREEPRPPVATGSLFQLAVRGGIVVMVGSIVVFVASVQPETLQQLRTLQGRYLALAGALVATSWLANGARTWLLARVLGHRLRLREALTVTLATEFATAATPGGVGGLAVRLSLQSRLGLRRTQSLSMIAADVTADLCFFAVLWPLGAVSLVELLRRARVTERLETDAVPLLLGVVALVTLAVLSLWAARRWLAPPAGRRARAIRRGIRRLHLNLLRYWRYGKVTFVLCCLAAAVQWTCRYGVLPLLLGAFEVPVPVLALMLLQGLLFLLSMVIILPGGGGSVELLAGLILPLVAPTSLVGVIVLLWRLLTYHLYLLVGGLVLWRQLAHDATEPPRT